MIEGFNSILSGAATDPNVGVVAGLGMGTVFAGLICLVIILGILNAIFSKINTKTPVDTKTNNVASVSNANEKMDDETVAAVSAAIAETMGRDVSGIKITSIKKVN